MSICLPVRRGEICENLRAKFLIFVLSLFPSSRDHLSLFFRSPRRIPFQSVFLIRITYIGKIPLFCIFGGLIKFSILHTICRVMEYCKLKENKHIINIYLNDSKTLRLIDKYFIKIFLSFHSPRQVFVTLVLKIDSTVYFIQNNLSSTNLFSIKYFICLILVKYLPLNFSSFILYFK